MNIVIIVGLTLFLILYLIYNPFILEGLATDESIIANIETQISKIPQQTTNPKIIGQKLSLHKQQLEKLNKILSDPKFSDSKINDPKTPKKVKDDTATNEERIQFLEIVNGLADEYLEVIKSVPTDTQLTEAK